MKRLTAWVAIVVLIIGMVPVLVLGTDKVLKVGTSAGFPPFEYVEGSTLVGIDIDLMEAIGDILGYKIEWTDIAFDSLGPALQTGKIDVIAAAMTIREDRQKWADFSTSYWGADQAIIVAKDSDLNAVEALSGDYKVGVQSGTTGEDWVADNIIGKGLMPANKLLHYDTYLISVKELNIGGVDSVVLDTPVAETFAKLEPVKVIGIFVTGENYGLAVKKGRSDLLNELNSAFSQLLQSGAWDEIVLKYQGS